MPRTMIPNSRPPLRQQGVGLLEVLIAVVILAVGLLGIAGLQVQALKTNQGSLQRSQVVMLSYFILDAMRADKANAKNGVYNINKTCNVPNVGALPDNNKHEWLQALKNGLGDTNQTCGQIACDAAGNCAVTVWWDDSRSGGNIQSMETRTRL